MGGSDQFYTREKQDQVFKSLQTDGISMANHRWCNSIMPAISTETVYNDKRKLQVSNSFAKCGHFDRYVKGVNRSDRPQVNNLGPNRYYVKQETDFEGTLIEITRRATTSVTLATSSS